MSEKTVTSPIFRTFGYCRASTRHQTESPAAQKEIILKYAAYNNMGDVTVFSDAAKSGKISWEDREAGKEMFRQIRAGDIVIIAKLDRAFRRLADCVLVLEKFKRMGVKLHITNMLGGAIDLSSPMGVFLIHILAAFAELERAFIAERIKEGLSHAKNNGLRSCHYPGYGFKWVKRTVKGERIQVKVRDDEERNVMRSILQWRTQDMPWSYEQIADHLTNVLKIPAKDGHVWDMSRVRRAYMTELSLQLKERVTVETPLDGPRPVKDGSKPEKV